MKKLLFLCLVALTFNLKAQNYPNILNYSLNGTPVYGVKIKTNLPFTAGTQMPTISIVGYSYIKSLTINLTLSYYVYATDFNDASTNYFLYQTASSSGGDAPRIFLSAENGKVVIFIDDEVYHQRFTVSAYADGMSEQASWFTGWTAVDEAISGIKTVQVPYDNAFRGNVRFAANGIWNADGNVGIGTDIPQEKLSVNGKIRAKEIKVEAANWPDYVFKPEYQLNTLPELELISKLMDICQRCLQRLR
ncbi:hypothetical protein [Pedobacter sp.]|uniref:hypothetical protein n=1 Tax=Pedobacter sp. TaxID=1411316 RepID=UPI0031E1CA6B